MGKISLKKLTIKNFRSFEGEHALEFDSSGLYLVKGLNLDTRGESAAGKSTIFHAIAYALDYAPYAAAEYHCWFNDGPMFVELELETENGSAIIHRGDKLWLKYRGSKVTSAKAVNEKLDEICGMNKKLREAITYRRQRSFGLFLSKKDSEKKAFLIELLGLHWLEKAIEEAVERVGIAKKSVEAFRPILELHQKLVQEAANNLSFSDPVDTTDLQLQVLEAQSVLERHKQFKANVQAELTLLINEERKLITPFKYDETAMWSIMKNLDQCRQRIKKLGNPDLEYQKYKQSIDNLKKETDRLSDSKCPRCDRVWDKAISEMEQNVKLIQSTNENLQKSQLKVMTLSQLQEVEDRLKRDLEIEQNSEREAEKLHHLNVQKKLTDPNRKSASKKRELDDIDLSLQSEINNYNRLAAKLSNLKHQNDINQKLKQQSQALYLAATSKLKIAEEEEKAAHSLLNSERDYLDLLRGFLGQIFGEILNEISEETNRILANLPNASKTTIRFETDRLIQDEKLKNEITPVAYFGGKKWPLESGSSGGMYTSIELAVDLAVSNVIAARTGVNLNWLILDESCANGSDKITKEGCLEILKQYSDNKLIIVVEHASEFKEFFSRIIEVELKDDRSRFV